jgi:hypothetical protein
VNWYIYLPPAISIFLLINSRSADIYLKHLVRSFYSPDPAVQASKDVIEKVALDWATRLGFFNSMFIALASSFSVYAGTQSIGLTIGTFTVILLIFIRMFYWIISHGVGQLATTTNRYFFNKPDTTVCNVILLIVYILLTCEIVITQNLSFFCKILGC